MKTQPRQSGWIPEDLVAEVGRRLEDGNRVRRTLPDGGRLHVDRQLPFLCVYRQPHPATTLRAVPARRADAGTRQLVKGEAAFLVATAAKRARPRLSMLVAGLAEAMSDRFGGFLIVELWSGPDRDVAAAFGADDVAPTEFQPNFVIWSPRPGYSKQDDPGAGNTSRAGQRF